MAEDRRAKEPITVLAGPFGHPLHPAAVALPIGAWLTSLVFDVASHIVSKPGFLAEGSQWLIAIGILGALGAACFGTLDLLAIPTGTPAFTTALTHAGLNVAITIAYVGNFLWRHTTYANGAAVPLGALGLSVASVLILVASGWLGGKLAYTYGVRVADEQSRAAGVATTDEQARAQAAVHRAPVKGH